MLLAIAVILPTVCLLWFMTRVVKNERLAVRQKLIDIYQQQLTDAQRKIDNTWSQKLKTLDEKIAGTFSYESFNWLVTQDGYDGLLVYDVEGKRIYPLLYVDLNTLSEPAEEFTQTWQLEFTEQNFAGAAELYEQKTLSPDKYVRFSALIGKSRCLLKLGRLQDAVETCKKVAFIDTQNTADTSDLLLISNARLLLLEFLKQDIEKYAALFDETLDKLLSIVYTTNHAGVALPADRNLFLAQKVLQMMRENSFLKDRAALVEARIQKLIAAEEHSVDAARQYPTAQALAGWQTEQFQSLQPNTAGLYGFYHKAADKNVLLLRDRENIISSLSDYPGSFSAAEISVRILDDAGSFIAGSGWIKDVPFIKTSAGKFFPGWRVELYLSNGDTFEKAASRQVLIYIWAGVLVIVLILATGCFAGQVVSRQIKLNRLKNDFIATVSHELKTPLSSMRVLVDTLLEGNYSEKKQASEYLQLISKENKRLSRLIDNFLTFSRMERNKQAFDIVRTNPAEIAKSAVEAVQTKFSNGKCRFDVGIDENLPDILADKDAVITVLVNLLDNAYKYSYDDRHIELKAFAEGASVCFSVKDNGIGISRRAVKRIFDRFYQVDSSLSRRTQGAGLGLSIVKFIVDAHKGQITVESKPGQGSAFTVKLQGV